LDSDAKEQIFKEIYHRIPVGVNRFEHPQEGWIIPWNLTDIGFEVAKAKDPRLQLGTLGGGNHFIEIGHDEDDNVWVVLHSGSRHFGHQIATEYMKLAHPEGKAKDGHFGFHVKSENGLKYINDMNIALKFALTNRKEMLFQVAEAIGSTVDEMSFINSNHNHAEYAHGMWIHRKGATHADEGMMGVIPGNMRDGSFIVKGKGSPDSLWSSSHGAGRVLGRKEAKRVLELKDFQETMIGVKAKVENTTLDESPFAYKNIFDVMDAQEDLVEIVHHIKPLINIKS